MHDKGRLAGPQLPEGGASCVFRPNLQRAAWAPLRADGSWPPPPYGGAEGCPGPGISGPEADTPTSSPEVGPGHPLATLAGQPSPQVRVALTPSTARLGARARAAGGPEGLPTTPSARALILPWQRGSRKDRDPAGFKGLPAST